MESKTPENGVEGSRKRGRPLRQRRKRFRVVRIAHGVKLWIHEFAGRCAVFADRAGNVDIEAFERPQAFKQQARRQTAASILG